MWASALPLATLVVARQERALYGLALAVYAIGSFVCHQLPQRSFYLWSVPMPVCARCAGIYAGAAFASLFFVRLTASAKATAVRRSFMRRRKPDTTSKKDIARVALIVAAVPTLASLLYEWTTGQAPTNLIRAVAGAPLGAAVGWVVVSGRRPDRRARGSGF